MKTFVKRNFGIAIIILCSNISFGQWSGTNPLWTNSNVGIGIGSPRQTLDVNGRIYVANGVIQRGGTSITGDQDLGLYSLNSGNWLRFVTNQGSIKFYSDGNINSVGSTPLVTIQTDGNLGIGSASPLYKLDIVGGSERVNGNDIFLFTDQNHGIGAYANGKTFAGQTINGAVVYGWQGGALGSTNTTPGVRIAFSWDNFGNSRINGYNLFLKSGTDVNHGLAYNGLSSVATIDGPVLFGFGGGALGSTNTTPGQRIALTWNASGNIGIGITNPQCKLHIKESSTTKAIVVDLGTTTNFRVDTDGKVFAREITVQTGAFPDYVFSNRYNLKTIQELDAYIKINKHLPNMPNASEVANNGLKLGAMNRLLVEKVEELTLYIISLQNQINELKK